MPLITILFLSHSLIMHFTFVVSELHSNVCFVCQTLQLPAERPNNLISLVCSVFPLVI